MRYQGCCQTISERNMFRSLPDLPGHPQTFIGTNPQTKMSVSPYLHPDKYFVIVIKIINYLENCNMNLLDVLTEREQRLCIQMIMGISIQMIALLNRLRISEVDECRKSIIRKFEEHFII